MQLSMSSAPPPSTIPSSSNSDINRLHSLFASGNLVHPYLSRDHFVKKLQTKPVNGNNGNNVESDVRDNFVDLAAALSICCGIPSSEFSSELSSLEEEDDYLQNNSFTSNKHVEVEIHRRRLHLASEIGGISRIRDDNNGSSSSNTNLRQHIILILCDGMGNSILQQHCDASNDDGFFIKHNQPSRLRAVFPSTTPAALTTLATATWPGQHGMPGWHLRDKKGCDLPGSHNETNNSYQPVQLLVLSDHIRDARSGQLASELGFDSWDDVFVETPWARKLACQYEKRDTTATGTMSSGTRRRMIYINAYNGDDYQNWVQGDTNSKRERKQSDATDFSAWSQGDTPTIPSSSRSSLFETAKIAETSFDTLGQPKGSEDALSYFCQGIDIALTAIANAEESGESTFIYLYTAHPDKHMHALGVEHEECKRVVNGIEDEVERLWNVLCVREANAAVVVTADHGHVTVNGGDMISLPQNILELLEYANVGVHGKGRHAYLHVRAGLQLILYKRWKANSELSENFLLLTVDEAIDNHLFGPKSMRVKVRPRLGDFIAISVGRKTLVSPLEVEKFQQPCKCQGAHGSLLPEEMSIPFILLPPNSK